MCKAEKTIRNAQRERSQKERLAELQDIQDDREDAYALNCILRRSNRERRKQEQAEAEAAAKRPPPNFAFPLLDADPNDAAAAKRAAVRAAPLLKRSRGSESSASSTQLIEL